MRHHRLILLGGALLALTVAPPAWAQGIDPEPLTSFGLGIHGGVFDPKDGDMNGFGGVHARLRLLPFLGFEGSADVREAKFKDDRVTVLQVPVQVSALIYIIPSGPIQPYLVGGVGWYYTRVDPEGGSADTSQEFGYHGGAGVDVPLGPNWVLNGDFRYFALADNVEGRDAEDIDADGWQVRLGITYYFR
jgi:opacity protein-like surface antigen